ncbi:MAG TPA: hypothetical protein ENJ02_00555 [Chloroflexi bacterium]|nr:hypothetical protein [Chloroflexota bacterium]
MSLLSRRNFGLIRYNSVWQNSAALLTLALWRVPLSLAFLGRVGLFFLFGSLMTAYGYLVNDLADVELDRRHGKSNAFAETSKGRAAALLLGLLVLGALAAWPFLRRPAFGALWVSWLGLATFYSLPPLRLKEHGLVGLCATVLAQQTLPLLLLLAAFDTPWSRLGLAFGVFATLRGLSSDLGHQVRDYANDARTGTRTFAVHIGYTQSARLYALSLEAERLALGGALLTARLLLPQYAPLITALGAAYLLLLALTLGRSLAALRRGALLPAGDPYDEARQKRRRDALHLIHHTFPSALLPLALGLLAAWEYPPMALFPLSLAAFYGLGRLLT